MKRRTFLHFCAVLSALVVLPVLALAQTHSGAIKVAQIHGSVGKISAGSTDLTPLIAGQPVSESDTIVTKAQSSVVLVFANGSSVKLGANTRLSIEEFKMDPLAETIAVATLKSEPTISKTRLHLAYGELVGDVKKLNTTGGSSFDVRTAIGAAGIRGTTFRITFFFQADGKVSFSLGVGEGTVAFRGTAQTSAGAVGTGTGTSVEGGQEISTVATYDAATNTVSSVLAYVPQSISAEASAAIVSAVNEAISQALQSTTFSTTEQTQSSSSPAPNTTPTQAPVELLPASPN